MPRLNLNALFISVAMHACLLQCVSAATLIGWSNTSNRFITIDTETGQGTALPQGSRGGRVHGLALDTTTQTNYAASYFFPDSGTDSLVTVNRETGRSTEVATTLGTNRFNHGMAYNSLTDTMYAIDGNRLYTVNTETFSRSIVGTTGFLRVERIHSLAFAPEAGVLYGVDRDFDRLVRIDPNTAQGTDIGTSIGVGSPIEGLAYDPRTATLYGVGTGSDRFQSASLVRIDTTTGVGTLIGPVGFGDIESLSLLAVPEPASVVSVTLLAMTGLLATRRRAALRTLALLGLAAPAIFCAGSTQAATIFSWTVETRGVVGINTNSVVGDPGMGIYFGYKPNGVPGNPAYGDYDFFTGRKYTAADNGRTFVENETTNSDFAAFAAAVTDGVDDGLFVAGHGAWNDVMNRQGGTFPFLHGDSETRVFSGSPSVDLAGYTVTELRLTIDHIAPRLAGGPPPTVMVLAGGMVTFEIEVAERPALLFNGPGTTPTPVPEPASAGIAALLSAAACLRRRRELCR